MSLPFIIGSAIVGGAISALSAADERRDALRRIDLITADLRDALITPEEERVKIDRVSDAFNTNLLSELNTASIPIAAIGASNPASARSEIAGRILGQRSESILRTQESIETYNRGIQSEIVRTNAGAPSGNSIGAFAVGAVAGTGLGIGLSEVLDAENELIVDDTLFDTINNRNVTAILPSVTEPVNTNFSGGRLPVSEVNNFDYNGIPTGQRPRQVNVGTGDIVGSVIPNIENISPIIKNISRTKDYWENYTNKYLGRENEYRSSLLIY